MIRAWRFVLVAAVILAGGCAKGPPIVADTEGIIRLDGVPLKRVEVSFICETNNAFVARGVSDDAGHFNLVCNGQPGAYEGANLVVIKEAEVPDDVKRQTERENVARYYQSLGGRPLPAQYSNLVDNPLKVTVKPDQKVYDLHLKR